MCSEKSDSSNDLFKDFVDDNGIIAVGTDLDTSTDSEDIIQNFIFDSWPSSLQFPCEFSNNSLCHVTHTSSPIDTKGLPSKASSLNPQLQHMHARTGEIPNGIGLEGNTKTTEHEDILEDVSFQSSFEEFEIEDPCWTELLKELDFVQSNKRNVADLWNSNSFDINAVCGTKSDRYFKGTQCIETKEMSNQNMLTNTARAFQTTTSKINLLSNCFDYSPSTIEENLSEGSINLKSNDNNRLCHCIIPTSQCSESFTNYQDDGQIENVHRRIFYSSAGSHVKQEQYDSDYSCNGINDLLLTEGSENASQKKLPNLSVFQQSDLIEICYAAEPQACAKTNLGSYQDESKQVDTTCNTSSDSISNSSSLASTSETCLHEPPEEKKTVVHDWNVRFPSSAEPSGGVPTCYESFQLASVLPSLPFALPSVPAGYQLVITHQPLSTADPNVQQQLKITVSNPSSQADNCEHLTPNLHKMLEPFASERSQSTQTQRQDMSFEVSSPISACEEFQELQAVTEFPIFVRSPRADVLCKNDCNLVCAASSVAPNGVLIPGVGLSGCGFNSSLSLKPNLELVAEKGLNVDHNRISAHDSLLGFSSVNPGRILESFSVAEIKSMQRKPKCTESPNISSNCSNKVNLSNNRENKVILPGMKLHEASPTFCSLPAVHFKTDLSSLVGGIFPPNVEIVGDQKLISLTQKPTLTCALQTPIAPRTSFVRKCSTVAESRRSDSDFLTIMSSMPDGKLGHKALENKETNQAKNTSLEKIAQQRRNSEEEIIRATTCTLETYYSLSEKTDQMSDSIVYFSSNVFPQLQTRTDGDSIKAAQSAQENHLRRPAVADDKNSEKTLRRMNDNEALSDQDPAVQVTAINTTVIQTSEVAKCSDSQISDYSSGSATCDSVGKYKVMHNDEMDADDAENMVESSGLENEAFPVPKIENLMTWMRLFLDAPSSTTSGESPITDRILYLNKGQYYRLSMECLGKNYLSQKTLFKSVVMVLFSDCGPPDDQLVSWETWHNRQQSYKQRILDVDYKDSYGVRLDSMEELAYNATAVKWHSDQPIRVNIAVNCLSTDFTNRKGVKGIPLLIQVDTFEGDQTIIPVNRSYCKIKVFCEKGAERKVRDEERKRDINKAIPKKEKDQSNGSDCTSSFSNFLPIHNLTKLPVLFQPNNNVVITQVVQRRNSLSNPESLRSEKRSLSCDSNVEPLKKSRPSKVIASKDCPKVLLYIRGYDDEAFTALLLHTPTVPALLDAIEEKCNIETKRIRTVYRKSRKGILVKMDDKILRHYSNESTFIIEVESVTSSETMDMYDVILSEIDVDIS